MNSSTESGFPKLWNAGESHTGYVWFHHKFMAMGVPGENLHGQSWAETPLSSPPAPLPCARDFQGPLTGFLEKVLPPHLRGEGLS